MELRDTYKNRIDIYQDRKGRIQFSFANGRTALTEQQIEELHLESSLYDIEDFDVELYKEAYNRNRNCE